MSLTPVRWGILGAAQIARKNWQAIRDAGNAIVAAVASRSRSSAEAFIGECQAECPFAEAPRAMTYDDLIESPEVDVVYLPIPTGLRIRWGLRAANQGKHILCEKPCANSVAELRQLTDLCQSRNLQFMDGVMFMHTDRLRGLQEAVSSGSIGKLRRITSQFCFAGGPEFHRGNIRMDATLEPFGCLGDLGWYNIRLTLALKDYELPQAVVGHAISSGRGTAADGMVPTEFSGEMLFADGVSAGFYCSFQTVMQQWGDISGDRGRVHIPDFVLPYAQQAASFATHKDAFIVEGCHFRMVPTAETSSFGQPANNAVDSQESRMVRTFSENVLQRSPDHHWIEVSLATQRVMDCLLESAHRGGEKVEV